jgi:hypothetical protein
MALSKNLTGVASIDLGAGDLVKDQLAMDLEERRKKALQSTVISPVSMASQALLGTKGALSAAG